MSSIRYPFVLVIGLVFSLSLIGSAVAAEYPLPVQKAIERLAKVLEVNAEAIEVVSYEFVEWPDSSLGVPRKDFGYLPVITGGYKVILAHAGKRYEYHTDTKTRVVLATSEPELPHRTGAPAAAVNADTPEARLCRTDLAKRLNVKLDEISVLSAKPATFTDGSLGFPRPGQVYTKAIEFGQRLTLECKKSQYLYAATDNICRYGGPVEARKYSAFYIEPIDNEPNLNGNLVQLALAGDNPVVVLEGVSDFRPQPDGSITAKRRTSRSGHELLYLAPGKRAEAVRLTAGLDIADAAVSDDSKRWAAVVRPGLGMGWQFVTAAVAEKPQGEPVALPAGLPQRVYLHMPNPVVRMLQEGKLKHYELVAGAFRPVSFYPPPTEEMMLHKSASLVVETKEVNGKPVTRVVSEWFTGDQTLRGTIENFRPTEYSVTPGKRFMLLSGKIGNGDDVAAYTVDLATGEVLQTLAKAHSPVRLLLAPSAPPMMMRP
ncbi:MAG: hypothetical protein ACYC63_10285 [Armatimonadota bacterium]